MQIARPTCFGRFNFPKDTRGDIAGDIVILHDRLFSQLRNCFEYKEATYYLDSNGFRIDEVRFAWNSIHIETNFLIEKIVEQSMQGERGLPRDNRQPQQVRETRA